MKAVILAGGRGSRLGLLTKSKPKPLIDVGGRPIIFQIMNIYAHHGVTDFVICLGHRGDVLRHYFLSNAPANVSPHNQDIGRDELTIGRWKLTLLDTGSETMTGGRLKRAAPLLGDGTFCLTYADGLADIDIGALVAQHHRSGMQATVTAVRPPARFGALDLDGARVAAFTEKPAGDRGWISGGFFVFEPGVIERIGGDATPLEGDPLSGLARDGQLGAYRHEGFWMAMDTPEDLRALERLSHRGREPWRVW